MAQAAVDRVYKMSSSKSKRVKLFSDTSSDESETEKQNQTVKPTVIKGKVGDLAESLLDQDQGSIPFDVTFKIVESDGETGEKLGMDIKAHKVILANTSPVFKTMFYGPLKETNAVIPIKQTTFEAFQKMMKFIYCVDIEYKDMAAFQLFDIVNLAERYQLPSLTNELENQMRIIDIQSIDHMMQLASAACKFSQFGSVSSALLLNCAKFAEKNLINSHKRSQFMLEQNAQGKDFVAQKLESMLPPVELCGDCGLDPGPCWYECCCKYCTHSIHKICVQVTHRTKDKMSRL